MNENKHPFEGLNQQQQIDAIIYYVDNVRDIVFQLQQKVEHYAKISAIQKSLIEMLIEESKYYSQQLGGYGQKPELMDKLKKQIEADFVAKPLIDFYTKKQYCADFDVSTKTFERLKKSGEIKVTTIGGSDYVAKKDMLDRLGLNE